MHIGAKWFRTIVFAEESVEKNDSCNIADVRWIALEFHNDYGRLADEKQLYGFHSVTFAAPIKIAIQMHRTVEFRKIDNSLDRILDIWPWVNLNLNFQKNERKSNYKLLSIAIDE